MERPPSTHMVGYSAFLSLSMLHQWSLVCPESLSALVWRDPCDDQVLMTLAQGKSAAKLLNHARLRASLSPIIYPETTRRSSQLVEYLRLIPTCDGRDCCSHRRDVPAASRAATSARARGSSAVTALSTE